MKRPIVPKEWVPGEGPLPSRIMLLGESPGWQEDRDKRPFVGKTGKELNRFLGLLHLDRRRLYITNLYKNYKGERTGKGYAHEDLVLNEPTLLQELEACQPTLIVTLGREAARWLLGDVDIESVHGIPWKLPVSDKFSMLRKRPIVFPIVHPAAGFHNPEMSPYVVVGFQQLGLYLQTKGKALPPRELFDDPIKDPDYSEITSPDMLDAALADLSASSLLALDTEGWPGNPWSVQVSLERGRAYLIRAVRPDLLRALDARLHRVRPTVILHNALHDLTVGRSLGLTLHDLPFHDTMILAYLLQIEPQGLKQGCLRHCNMRMRSYEEVLAGTTNRLAQEYLIWLWEGEEFAHDERRLAEFEARKAAGRRIKKIPELPRSPFHKALQRAIQSKRPAALWEEQDEAIQAEGVRKLGLMPQATLDYVDPEKAIRYGCRDADGTTRLLPVYLERARALKLDAVYDLERSTYPFLARMQQAGVKPDLEHFKDVSVGLGAEIESLQHELAQATGLPAFNANSGDQVAAYLFDRLGLEPVKLTKSGRGSTNDKILEALEHEHPEYPVLSTIRSYRETYKLKYTFVDQLPAFCNRWPHDGRIHSTFRTTRVITGRLAATDPNMLAQPEHGKFAKDFRRGWVAEPGHVLCQWDESQVELRGLAHLSQDPVLLAVYRGEMRNPDGSLIDLHARLAQRIFGGDVRDYMKKCLQRLAAKAINFGIPMGMTNKGLSVELRKNGVDADEDTAQRWLDDTLSLYKGVPVFMDECIAEARRNGFIRCMSGRIRYIGGIHSADERVREEAERFAFSTKIQESATYIMKQAEASIYEDVLVPLWGQGKWVEPILQVHDALKFECEEGLEQDLHLFVSEAMTHVPHGLSVPLAVEGEWGYNMADMRPF